MDMLDELKAHLIGIGLSEKEAAVYLALLELRATNPQTLARRAAINRSTTYLALESLQKRGLVSSVEKDNKMHYVAEHPERLAYLVEAATRQVEERRELIQTALPHLMALFQTAGDAPRVRFFEGADAFQAAREEMWATREPLWEVYAADESMLQVAALRGEERIKMTARARGWRVLVAVKPGCVVADFDPLGVEARQIDYHRCPFSGSVTIAGRKLCVMTRQAQGMGILVDSDEMTRIFCALFEAVWQSARPLKLE